MSQLSANGTFEETRFQSPSGANINFQDPSMLTSHNEWRHSATTIKEKLYNSLLNGCFADIRFMVGHTNKKEIPAHKLILFLHSPVFEALLEGSQLNKPITVSISDVEPEAFHSFLKYLYTDEFDVQVKDATAILYLSKKYDIPGLAILTAEFIKNNISTKNVVSVLLSAESLGETSIAIQARYFLKKNIRYVIHEDDFLQLNVDELSQLFASDELQVSELELFNAAVHWANQECKRQKLENTPQNYRLVLKSILPLIRFPLMDRREFTLQVATKNILTDSECLNIMMHWDVMPKERASLPPLLFNNKPRSDGNIMLDNVNPAMQMQAPSFSTLVAPMEHSTGYGKRRDVVDPLYYEGGKMSGRIFRGQPEQVMYKPPPPPRKPHASRHVYPVNYVDYGAY